MSEVAFPTVLQKEKVAPVLTVVLFNVLQVILILFCLEESLEYIFVENVASCSSLYWGSFCFSWFEEAFSVELSSFRDVLLVWVLLEVEVFLVS